MNVICSGLCDSDGDTLKCKCGKQAISGAFGKEAYIAWCQDCCPMLKQDHHLVDTRGLQAEWGSAAPFRFATSNENAQEAWKIDMREKKE